MTTFDVPYDYLIIAVVATVNTFGIKGVQEHCQFLKQVGCRNSALVIHSFDEVSFA